MREHADPVVAVCDSLAGARAVADALAREGFDPTALSVVGIGEAETLPHTVDERLRKWIGVGGIWGALGGLAAGILLVVPPLGPVLAAGPLATMLLAALEGAAVGGGLSALVGALTSAGLQVDDARVCESEIAARRFVVFVHGTRDDERRARGVVRAADIAEATVA
jgi:hypothetical protein